jgi:hypothetical protein
MNNFEPPQIMNALANRDQAWQQGNRLVLRQNGRWHYLTLSPDLSHIAAINFMTPERAEDMIENMRTQAGLIRFSDIAPSFTSELAQKVLPDAESYRLLLANGRCHLIMGHTTDTLHTMEADIDTLIDTIDQLMKSGKPGPYLSFR